MKLGFSLHKHINKMLSRIPELEGKYEGRENYIMRNFIICNLQPLPG
jgi:hypothetical protein